MTELTKINKLDQYKIPEDRLLDRTEAAKIIGVKPTTLRKWCCPSYSGKHKLPFIKSVTGRVRYRYSDLIEFLEKMNPDQVGKLNNIGLLVD